MSERRYGGFRDFWPFYLSQHSRRGTRLLHVTGTSLGLLSLAAAVGTGNGWLVLLGLVLGYALAWTGHFFVERNRPATFKYPLRSFAADFKLWGYTLAGRIDQELARWGLLAQGEGIGSSAPKPMA